MRTLIRPQKFWKLSKSVSKNFGCNKKQLCTVVSDSGSNMSAVNGIQKCYKWLPCCDNKRVTALTTVLNKTTTSESGVKSTPFYRFEDEAPEIFDLIDNCKSLVTYFKEANLQDSLSSTRKQENAMQWNSIFHFSSTPEHCQGLR